MNRYQAQMMDAPSIETKYCPFCGRPASNRHHIVPRSQGGEDGPTVTVCGHGNVSGCHKRLHMHTLHLWWNHGEWWYFESGKAMKLDEALRQQSGWRKVRTDGED